MSQLNAPKPAGNLAQLARVAAILGPILFVLNQAFTVLVLNEMVHIYDLVVMAIIIGISILASVFMVQGMYKIAIVFGAILALPFSLLVIQDLVVRNWLMLGFPFGLLIVLVHLGMLGSAVTTVLFSVKAGAEAKRGGSAAVPQPQAFVPAGPSDRKWVTALLLALFFGPLGFDRLYVGRTGLAIAKLLTAGGLGVWALVDFILLCVGKMNDVHGRPLQR